MLSEVLSAGTTTNFSWMTDKSLKTGGSLKTEGALVLIDPYNFLII